MRHMRRGEWDRAWQVGDAVLRARGGARDWSLPRHLQAVWDGSPIEGRRVLLRCYHGLGDTIQFIRFAPLVRARAAALTVWAQPALIPLLRTLPGVGELLPLHDGTPEVDYEVDLELMELPHLLRVTPASLPAEVPYLFPPKVRVAPWRGLPRGLDVGLVWRSGDWNWEHRSLPFTLLAPLGEIPGVRLHVLQRGEGLAECPPGFGLPAGTDDILEAAGVMAGLDLVISIDSMPAHLAGALGRPVWTLLAHEADWRWMEGREDSPWYPTMRLFRQPRPGDWGAVVARVAAELRALAAPEGTAGGTTGSPSSLALG
jgi:Glycosyltransferase family 9 (heptosyltransferase)